MKNSISFLLSATLLLSSAAPSFAQKRAAEPKASIQVICDRSENYVKRHLDLSLSLQAIADAVTTARLNGTVYALNAVQTVSIAPYDIVFGTEMFGSRLNAVTFKIMKTKKNLFGKVKNVEVGQQTIPAVAGVTSSYTFSESLNGSGISCQIQSN